MPARRAGALAVAQGLGYAGDQTEGEKTMDPWTAWWIATGALLVLEMGIGTLYLLMLALGTAAAALAAHAGWGLSAQLGVAAAVGLSALWVWHRWRTRASASAADDRNVHLDIGEELDIAAWSPEGEARVQYRGAQWSAVLPAGQAASPGRHRVVALSGNRLVVEKI